MFENYRRIYNSLAFWMNSEIRKPLILRGARQVGKTTVVRTFAENFDNYIELNLEKKAQKALFIIDDIDKIINAACLLKKVKLKKGKTLLFIDEIQESPEAIQLLRYFYEERPDIYVIAAGSLLEFALRHVSSFPVGRVEFMYLYPLNFEEYLIWSENELAEQLIQAVPIPDYVHNQLIDLFHEFSIIGGMPSIVASYLKTKNIATLSRLYKQLWDTYKNDVEKYAKNNTELRIVRHIIETAVYELDRIKFEGFGNSSYRSREVGEAMRTLDAARIIRIVYPTTNVNRPIISDLKKRPRLQFLDTGLINQLLNHQGEMLYLKDLSDFHRGRIIQHLVNQELIAIDNEQEKIFHFWVREEKNSNSEVDIVFEYKDLIIPIEIKSGASGKLRSLHEFMDRTNHQFAIRLYAGNFGIEKVKSTKNKEYFLMNLPYYLSSKIYLYMEYFVKQIQNEDKC
jgi:predicted AAA+ superfamily ATPase